MLGAMTSLTGGGGLSNETTATSGANSTGNVYNIGSAGFNPFAAKSNNKMIMAAGVAVVGLGVIAFILKRK